MEDGPRSSTALVLGGVRDAPFTGVSEGEASLLSAMAPSVLPLACAWDQAGAPAISSGLGLDVSVSLKASLLVTNSQI